VKRPVGMNKAWVPHPIPGAGPGLRRNCKPLATLGSAAFEYQPSLLRAHAHQKPVGALPAATVWLERTLHDVGSLEVNEDVRRNLDTSQAARRLSIARRIRGLRAAVCHRPVAMLESPPCELRRVTPRSFPQLWKKMWKSQGFRPPFPCRCRNTAAFGGAKAENRLRIGAPRACSHHGTR
jgi:hypothetical protein